MMKTRDIDDILEEINFSRDDVSEQFDEWVMNYSDFSILLKPDHVKNKPEEVKNWLMQRAKNTPVNYFKVHIAGEREVIKNVPKMINRLKYDEERLNYDNMNTEYDTLGFRQEMEIYVYLHIVFQQMNHHHIV